MNALWWRPHPTHLSIGEAVDAAQALGARRTYLTHLTHETGHAELAAQLPAGRHARLRRAHRGDSLIKLAYGRMLQDGLDGQHGLPRARLAELARRFAAVQAEVRRRRAAGEYGFYDLVDQGPTVRQITTFAEGLGQAYDHVLVLGIGGSALGTKALLNALRRPAWNELDDEGREFYPRLTVLDNVDPDDAWPRRSTRIDPRRVLVERDQQVGRHRGDDGAVPRGPRLAGASAGRRGVAPPRVHHRSGAGRAAGAGARATAIATLDVPPAVGGRFSVLSPVGLLAGGAGRHRHRRRCSPARDGRCERASADDLLRNPAALYAALHWAADTDARRAHPCAHAVHRPPARFRRVVSSAVGREPGQAADRAGRPCMSGPRRSAPSARPTSTARCSSSWKGRSTRSSPSFGVERVR